MRGVCIVVFHFVRDSLQNDGLVAYARHERQRGYAISDTNWNKEAEEHTTLRLSMATTRVR